MKKLIFILAVVCSLQLSAQDQSNWLTDNTTALSQSKAQNKPVLVFVTNNQTSEASENLKQNFFNSKEFNELATKSVLLKLDISDKNSANARLGIHYTKQNGAPGIAIIDYNGRALFKPLVDVSSESVKEFMTLWNDNL